MDNVVDWLVIGRFGKTHGLKGQITVHSFTEPRDNILRYTDWYALINKQWQPLTLLRLDATDKNILAVIEGYKDREQLAELTNIDIAVDRKQLPALPPGDYYWHDLIGLKVINCNGTALGLVNKIMPTGSNDVLVVIGEKRHLIPYLPVQFICSIDKEQGIIVVDWDSDF